MTSGGASQSLMKTEAKEMAASPRGRTILARRGTGNERPVSNMEADVQDIAVLNDVILAFHPDQPFVPGRGHGPGGDEIRERNHFSADEALFHVRVNFPGGLRNPGSPGEGPGAKL